MEESETWRENVCCLFVKSILFLWMLLDCVWWTVLFLSIHPSNVEIKSETETKMITKVMGKFGLKAALFGCCSTYLQSDPKSILNVALAF